MYYSCKWLACFSVVIIICKWICTSIHRELAWGYILFSCIRFFFRLIACYIHCAMMYSALRSWDPSNPTSHKFYHNIIQITTGLCCELWVFKLIISFIEPCAGRKIEVISDIVSFMTLWIGEIPNTGFHLLFVCKHANTYHQIYTEIILISSICKLVERLCGIILNYDWRYYEYRECYSMSYILGVAIKLLLHLALIVVPVKGK